MAEYTHAEHLAAITALMRMRKKFVNIRAVEKIAPGWIRNDAEGQQLIRLILEIMDELIQETDRMITEKDYK